MNWDYSGVGRFRDFLRISGVGPIEGLSEKYSGVGHSGHCLKFRDAPGILWVGEE